MIRKYIYMILAALGLIFSCQRVVLPEEKPVDSSGDKVFGEATITFSTLLPSGPQTKAMGDAPFGEGDNPDDIKSLYLVIFDANGMLVESRPATIIRQKEHQGVNHLYESEYSVTLTMSDQPRIIHFIANCPVDQIAYGHETSIIGNMYVEKDQDADTPETAYWARITVDDLIVADIDTDDPHFANNAVQAAFQCVPLLRNFAQISVLHDTNIQAPDGVTFEYLGFAVYNTVDMGTVAPYSNKMPYTFETGKFQSFLEPGGTKTYSYPDFQEMQYPYEGHALSAADLNQSLEIADPTSEDDATKYKWYGPDESFFMYERKVSVQTDNEAMWNESPPHLIIKARYNGDICYYKVDLVYKITENGKVREIKYYNILRNFRYQFTIKSVEHKGYNTVLEAINGATSNNLAGSSTTSKFTNISDKEGRLWVSYTDKLLVTGDPITFYYRYEPELGSGTYNNNLITENGGFISFNDPYGGQIAGGSVISSFEVGDEITEGEWTGYRKIDIGINAPDTNGEAYEQSFILRTDKATLSREIRLTLREKYTMTVECTPAVLANIDEKLKLDIKLPGGLTENTFPLALRIEVANLSLSPDASQNTIPVEVGKSTIEGKVGQPTFYYIKTIDTKADYDALPTEGTNKVVRTHWVTNIAKSASDIYVTNAYFNDAHDSFLNGVIFKDLKITPDGEIFYGEGESASITFKMSDDDDQYNQKDVTVTLNGLADQNGNSVFTVRPDNRTVNIGDLVTTSVGGNVSFTVSHPEYISVTSDEVARHQGVFSNLKVGNNSNGGAIPKGADLKTSVSFSLDKADNNYRNRQIIVQFVGLVDENGASSMTLTPTGRDVLIQNLYTRTAEGNIRVTVSEQDGEYADSVANFTRRDRAFTNLKFVDKESLGGDAEEPVDFEFEIPEDEYVAGMTVNVELVGLAPSDENETLSPVTRATSYVYSPNTHGTQTFHLQTTEDDVENYIVRLSADGFESAEKAVPVVDGLLFKEISLILKLNHSSPENYSVVTTITAQKNGTVVEYRTTGKFDTITGNKKPYTCNVYVKDLLIKDYSNDTEIKIRCECTRNTKYTYEKTVKLTDLINNQNVDMGQK